MTFRFEKDKWVSGEKQNSYFIKDHWIAISSSVILFGIWWVLKGSFWVMDLITKHFPFLDGGAHW